MVDVFDFDLNFKVGIAPVTDKELLDGNDHFVVKAIHAHETSSFLQHTDNFQVSGADADFFAEGRFVNKKIGGHIVANDADRPARGRLGRREKTALANGETTRCQELIASAD